MEESMSNPSIFIRPQPGMEPVEYHPNDIIRAEFGYEVKVVLRGEDGAEYFRFIPLSPSERGGGYVEFVTYEQARAHIWNTVSKETNLSFAALKAAVLADSILPNKMKGVRPPSGYMVVCDSDGYETFMHADHAILVPLDYLDSDRIARLDSLETEKLFKHGGPFPGIELNEVIEMVESKRLLDGSHVEWMEGSYKGVKKE